MNYRVNLLWKVVTRLSSDGLAAVRSEHGLLFNRKGGGSILRRVGGDFRATYAPVVLQPTDVYHQALCGIQNELGFQGSRFPISLELDFVGQRTRLNISQRLYGDFVCATCSLDEFECSLETDFSKLQELSTHQKLYAFISRALAITVSGDRRAEKLGQALKTYPAIRIEALGKDSPSWQCDLVGLVTRHPGASLIIDAVSDKNARHQIDASRLLVDKQGIAGYVPVECSRNAVRSHRQRFDNATAMIEYSAMLQRLLATRQWLPEATREAILNPEEAIPNSVSARYMWALLVKEFSLQTELKSWSALAVKPTAARILLVTITSVESRAVHTAFAKATGSPAVSFQLNGFTYQNLGRLGNFEIIHAISGMGSGGIAGSQESVRRGIEAIMPFAVLMIGIAFGIDPDSQNVADVLVSRQVLMYELQRLSKDFSIQARGDKVTASPKLLDWVAHAEIKWDESRSKVQTGLFLSGEKLVDNVLFRDNLRRLAPEAIGGEMEAAGVYVACQNAKIDWLVIKAICDWADGYKGANKEANQALAANSAADFAVHVLSIGASAMVV